MHIGILGGSFNPPHLGHILAAQQVLDFTSLSEVWFLPAFKHTFDKPLAPVFDRVAMAKLLELPRTRVSTLEVDHKLSGDTIELVPLFKKLYPEHSFTFIIGSDQLVTFTKWGSWEKLLTILPFLVVPRARYPMEPIYKGMKPLFHPLFVETNISSSMIRQRIKKRLSIADFVPKKVADYVSTHQLYQ